MITGFIIYVPATGQILRTGTCPASMVEIQAQLGEAVMEGYADPSCHYIVAGEVVDLPPCPSHFHVFDWTAKTWNPDAELAARQVRAQRGNLIAAVDWTQLPDVPPATQQKWRAYRQALRDITDQEGFPFNVAWPTPPD